LIFIHLNAFPKFKDKNDSEHKNENKFKLRYIDEEKVYLKKFSFQSLFYFYNYDQKVISPKEFREFNFFESFPNYLNISYEKDNINNIENIKFSLASKIFEEALLSETSFKIKNMSLNILMNKEFFPRTAYGIDEELLIILLLKYNKFKNLYFDFKGKNFLEVEKINDLKNSQNLLFKRKIILEKMKAT